MENKLEKFLIRTMVVCFFLSWIEHLIERPLSFMGLPTPTWLVVYVSVLMIIYSVIHATQNIGTKNFLVFFGIAVVITAIFEEIKIGTGFLQYSDGMGNKVFGIPFTMPLWFFILIYSAYFTTNVVFNLENSNISRGKIIFLSLIDGIVTTSWLTMEDSINVTLKNWKWSVPGDYFGSPAIIFVFWISNIFIIAFLYRLYEKYHPPISRLKDSSKIIGKYLPFFSYTWLAFSAPFGAIALKHPGAAVVGVFAAAPFVLMGFNRIFSKPIQFVQEAGISCGICKNK